MSADNERARWHPCNEFIDPLMQRLKPLIGDESNVTTEEAIAALLSFVQGDDFRTGEYWIEANAPQYLDVFTTRIKTAVEEAAIWLQDAQRVEIVDGELQWTTTAYREGLEIRPMSWARQLKTRWRSVQSELGELYAWLNWLASWLRQRVSFEKVAHQPQFVPSEMQRMVLEALTGRAMTQLELMTALDIGSKETFNGKRGRGGMKEIIELGLVVSDKRKGGYYRPDAPPTESVL